MVATVQSLGIDRLSIADRMRLVEEIWDTIANEPKSVEMPEWHRHIIKERIAEDEANPNAGVPWDEAQARIREKLARKSQ